MNVLLLINHTHVSYGEINIIFFMDKQVSKLVIHSKINSPWSWKICCQSKVDNTNSLSKLMSIRPFKYKQCSVNICRQKSVQLYMYGTSFLDKVTSYSKCLQVVEVVNANSQSPHKLHKSAVYVIPYSGVDLVRRMQPVATWRGLDDVRPFEMSEGLDQHGMPYLQPRLSTRWWASPFAIWKRRRVDSQFLLWEGLVEKTKVIGVKSRHFCRKDGGCANGQF